MLPFKHRESATYAAVSGVDPGCLWSCSWNHGGNWIQRQNVGFCIVWNWAKVNIQARHENSVNQSPLHQDWYNNFIYYIIYIYIIIYIWEHKISTQSPHQWEVCANHRDMKACWCMLHYMSWLRFLARHWKPTNFYFWSSGRSDFLVKLLASRFNMKQSRGLRIRLGNRIHCLRMFAKCGVHSDTKGTWWYMRVASMCMMSIASLMWAVL